MSKRHRIPKQGTLDQVTQIYELTLKWEKSRNEFDLQRLICEREKLPYTRLLEIILAYAGKDEPAIFRGGHGKS